MIIIKKILEFIFLVKSIYLDYQESNNKRIFVKLYTTSTSTVIVYFIYFVFVFGFFLFYVTSTGLIRIYLFNANFALTSMSIYNYRPKNLILDIIKYYLIDLPCHHAYLIFYTSLEFCYNNWSLDFLQSFWYDAFIFIIIQIVSFPVFFIKVINKLYKRLNSSYLYGSYNKKFFIMNVTSMFAHDFKKTLLLEGHNIYYLQNILTFSSNEKKL